MKITSIEQVEAALTAAGIAYESGSDDMTHVDFHDTKGNEGQIDIEVTETGHAEISTSKEADDFAAKNWKEVKTIKGVLNYVERFTAV